MQRVEIHDLQRDLHGNNFAHCEEYTLAIRTRFICLSLSCQRESPFAQCWMVLLLTLQLSASVSLAVGMRACVKHMALPVPLESPAFFWRFRITASIIQLRREEYREFPFIV